jgi:hypothetical protein
MKPLSATVAAAFLVLIVVVVIAFIVVAYVGADHYRLRYYAEPLMLLYFLFLVLAAIFAVVSAIKSPQAPLTRAVFCGLSFLFGLFGLYLAPQFLSVGGPVASDYVSYSLALFMTGIAFPSVLTIALARNKALLYCAYGLVVALCLINFRLDYQIVVRGILSG